MDKGWISIHRKVWKHWLIEKNRPLTRFEAWLKILSDVNHEGKKVLIKGELFEVKRGESINSLDTWGREFNWDKSKVRRFLKLLESDRMVVLKSERITTRLIVCNYDTYQNEQNANETQTKRRRNADETQTTPNNNDNNVNNDNKNKDKKDFIDKIIDAFQKSYFENFDLEYNISNKGKERGAAGKIAKIYKKKYPEAKTEEILSGLKIYFDMCCQINDNWLSNNMSLPIIVSKFNEINKILKNGKNKSGNERVKTEQIARNIAKHFATDYTE